MARGCRGDRSGARVFLGRAGRAARGAWGSAPANIIPRKLMGIEPVEPGFRTVRIRPQPGGLESVRVKTPTVRGAIETAWTRDGGRYRFDVALPANVRAEVWLPGASAGVITEGGQTLDAAAGVEVAEQRGGRVVVRVTGGAYRFEGAVAVGQ